MMTPIARRHFFGALQRHFPQPTTELRYEGNYQLLTAVVLSAQATDKGVNAATADLFIKVKTPQDMLALGEEKLLAHIRSIGLFRAKARHIMALSAILTERHGGQVPDNRQDLEALPGVGRKTANVVLNTAFGQETIAVDTHIFRVGNRTGLAPGKTPRAVEDALNDTTPARYKKDAHHLLILLGRYICKARKPLCGDCPARRWCAYPHKTENDL